MTDARKRRGLGDPAKSMAELVEDMHQYRKRYPGESLGQSIAERVARLQKQEEIPKRIFSELKELPQKRFKKR